jgi:hypothetical protein
VTNGGRSKVVKFGNLAGDIISRTVRRVLHYWIIGSLRFRRFSEFLLEPSEQEKQLQELVFGKDIVAATSERQSTSVKVRGASTS